MANVDISNKIVKSLLAGDVQSVSHQVDASEDAIATANTYQVIKLAPYTIIHNCQVVVDTAQGATATANIGLMGDDITDDVDALDASINLNAAAGSKTFSVAGTDAGIGLNIGASGGWITVKAANALDTAVFTITIVSSLSQNV